MIRDFGIKPFRAKQLAQRETFSFAQGCPVFKYFNTKLACLKIACIEDLDMQCSEIRDGIKDPEFRTVIHLKEANNTMAWLRQELMDLETDCRALWQKSQRASRPPPTPFQRTYALQQHTSTPPTISQTPARGALCSASHGRVTHGRRARPLFRSNFQALSTPAAVVPQHLASEKPSRACHFCGGQHWDRECSYSRPSGTAYHCYNLDVTQEEYDDAEEEYAVLQT